MPARAQPPPRSSAARRSPQGQAPRRRRCRCQRGARQSGSAAEGLPPAPSGRSSWPSFPACARCQSKKRRARRECRPCRAIAPSRRHAARGSENSRNAYAPRAGAAPAAARGAQATLHAQPADQAAAAEGVPALQLHRLRLRTPAVARQRPYRCATRRARVAACTHVLEDLLTHAAGERLRRRRHPEALARRRHIQRRERRSVRHDRCRLVSRSA